MQKVKEFIQELRDIANYKSQIKLLNKRIEELKKEPQKLIDKMNLMKIGTGIQMVKTYVCNNGMLTINYID